jgi:hypothetical protein
MLQDGTAIAHPRAWNGETGVWFTDTSVSLTLTAEKHWGLPGEIIKARPSQETDGELNWCATTGGGSPPGVTSEAIDGGGTGTIVVQVGGASYEITVFNQWLGATRRIVEGAPIRIYYDPAFSSSSGMWLIDQVRCEDIEDIE